jgi:hypothetical protein
MRIELPVGLGPRASHSWAFSAIENTELNAAKIGDSAHKAVQSIDFPDQMAFSKPANGGITGHSADSAKPVGYEGRLGAHTGRRGRGFTAGVAAANYNDVESMRHQNLGWRVLAEARGGVKIIGFIENVSRETLPRRPKTNPFGMSPTALVENTGAHMARRWCRDRHIPIIIHNLISRCRSPGK